MYKDYVKALDYLRDNHFLVGYLDLALELEDQGEGLTDTEKEHLFNFAKEVYLKTEDLTPYQIVNGLVQEKDSISDTMSMWDIVQLVLDHV